MFEIPESKVMVKSREAVALLILKLDTGWSFAFPSNPSRLTRWFGAFTKIKF
jgi:hypothetical protein